MSILVVDDSKAMRCVLKKTLQDAGYCGHHIDEADDGAMALEKVLNATPDVVMSDWNTPVMTGIELLAAIKSEGISCAFGFVTTESTHEMRRLAADAGATFMISRPFTPQSFREALEPVLARTIHE